MEISTSRLRRIPQHVAFIPDGNRRWAQARGLGKAEGYSYGVRPALELCDLCARLGVRELTGYGFTQDNTRRAPDQRAAFQDACIEVVEELTTRDVSVLVVGEANSRMFPRKLLPFTQRTVFGTGQVRINLLVNYDWEWDLSHASMRPRRRKTRHGTLAQRIASSDVPRIDLIIRWGGRTRLSGFLPVQSVYADFYMVDDLWPDFRPAHFMRALRWYQDQDPTLGG